jgi:iron(III) transport system ATP-binding protein
MGKEIELFLKNIVKIFGAGTEKEVRAVDDLTLQVQKSQLVTLLGPSGCGKTTILRLIAGFEDLTSGEIYLRGRVINNVPPQKRDVAMVFQNYALFPHMTVFENIAYGLKVRKMPRKEIKSKVAEVLNLVDMEKLQERPIGQLSGGQQQRVALCRAIVVEPTVLLFDEPLSNLDAKLRKGTRQQIRSLQQKLGITSVYVTHDQEEAMGISDKIAVMNKGQIEQVASPPELYTRPKTKFIADFLGETYFHTTKIVESVDKKLTVKVFGKQISIEQSGNFKIGDEVDVLIRPEAVDLVKAGTGDINGKVVFSHYLGSIVTYELKLDNGDRIEVRLANPQESRLLKKGTKVGLKLHKHNLFLFKSKDHL